MVGTTRAVVSVGVDAWYPRGVARLMRSLSEYGLGERGHFYGWIDSYPPGAPGAVNVKACKPFAMKYAAERDANVVLWLDASAWAIASLAPLFELVENSGHLLLNQGFTCRGWCADSTMRALSVNDWQELESIEQIRGSVVGLDLRREVSRRFLNEWLAVAVPTTPRVLPCGKLSLDPEFKAHRWQVTQSVLAHRLGMHVCNWQDTPITWTPDAPRPGDCLATRGM